MQPSKKFLVALTVVVFLTVQAGEALAKLGRGGSMGYRGGQSTMAVKPQQSPQALPMSPQTAAPKPGATQGAPGAKAGMLGGGMMGILGGLALGGMLGALLFGGAFEGINLFDIVIFGLIAFILFRLFRAKLPQPLSAPAGGRDRHEMRGWLPEHQTSPEQWGAPMQNGAPIDPWSEMRALMPEFNEHTFLSGAKAAFGHLQQAYSEGDTPELVRLLHPRLLEEIQSEIDDLRDRGLKNLIEVVQLDAVPVQAWCEGDEAFVTVRFSGLLRDEIRDSQGRRIEGSSDPHTFAEHWTFMRGAHETGPVWRLSAIQQEGTHH